MKDRFTLSIPTPCHEKWNSFSTTKLGGFCSSCKKEVIDFTKWDEEQIKKYFSKHSSVCGRFSADQLKEYTSGLTTSSHWIPASFFSLALTVLPDSLQATDVKQLIVTHENLPSEKGKSVAGGMKALEMVSDTSRLSHTRDTTATRVLDVSRMEYKSNSLCNSIATKSSPEDIYMLQGTVGAVYIQRSWPRSIWRRIRNIFR
ncbi:MAG TPA: hypothetical protein VIN08_11335 [Ohtaekwangia sp.]|uniref:hypothetical protein n=1 Tax=Ohtaekwangia sp. TaxID=2066019 RepID=UPI002F92A890